MARARLVPGPHHQWPGALRLGGLLVTGMPVGHRPVYRIGDAQSCPACGGRHWIVGRHSAECAHCATALPIAEGSSSC